MKTRIVTGVSLLGVLCATGLMAGLPRLADADAREKDPWGDQEVAFANYGCFTDPSGVGSVVLRFIATAGIGSVDVAGPGGGLVLADGTTCEALTNGVVAIAQASSCTTGPVRIVGNPAGYENRSLFISCGGIRNRVVRAMGLLMNQVTMVSSPL